jgi:hypothetical protein
MTIRKAQDPGPIEQTENQLNPYLARPEDFAVRRYDDPISGTYHGQDENDAEAEKRRNEKFNTGSTRAKGDVNHAGRHTREVSNEVSNDDRSP